MRSILEGVHWHGAESSPAERILATERHGTTSEGMRVHWKELVVAASSSDRQKSNKEFTMARERKPHLAVPPSGP